MPIIQDTLIAALNAAVLYKEAYEKLGHHLQKCMDSFAKGEITNVFEFHIEMKQSFDLLKPDQSHAEFIAAELRHYRTNASRNILRRRRFAERKSGIVGDITKPRPTLSETLNHIRTQNDRDSAEEDVKLLRAAINKGRSEPVNKVIVEQELDKPKTEIEVVDMPEGIQDISDFKL